MAPGAEPRHPGADTADGRPGKKLKLGAGFLAGAITFACATCSPTQQITRGCRAPAPAPVLTIDGEHLYRCPVALITRDTAALCRLYPHYTRGVLPVAGGVLDQAAVFLAAMQVLEAEIAAQRPTRG